MSLGSQPLEALLAERLGHGPMVADELLRLFVPLFEQVCGAHARDRVAPLEGLTALEVLDGRAYFSQAAELAPRLRSEEVATLDRRERHAIEVVSRLAVDTTGEGDAGGPVVGDLAIHAGASAIERPVFLPGYRCWEHTLGHHDPLTDVFSLGLLLASFGCALDLREVDDLERFVASRANPRALNERLHPVIAKLITRMTEPSRRERAQDLPALLATLRSYREQRLDLKVDLGQRRGFQVKDVSGPRGAVHARLRERLFEISRRNRLLYFRPTLSSLNLTESSVPLVLDYTAIAPSALFTWQGDIAASLSAEKPLSLGKFLRFEDAPYIGPVLDKIRNEDRRNRAELGFSQLRLALAFLRWHDLKEEPEERISSPLVLLPVTLEKRKGVRDAYVLTPTTDLAEINPVLRFVLREKFGIALPEAIDLGEAKLDALFETLREQILASEPGVTLRLVDRPQIRLVHERAKARLEQFRRSSSRAGRRMRSYGPLDYSYHRDSLKPLGLQLFLQRVRPAALPTSPQGRTPLGVLGLSMVAGEVVESQRYALVGGQDDRGGPYAWDFDLCAATLGNFHYRKMSLVRDYDALVGAGESPHAPFDAVFSLVPRGMEEAGEAQAGDPEGRDPAAPEASLPSVGELPVVVPADPTQARAILRSRKPGSYIIQGPPGTGKSQTITNLVADFVARGKRVLFVCEKRAAIDVVFHRLKQVGLDHLCALIHDSQSDKRELIAALKQTAERYLGEPDRLEGVAAERKDLLTRLEADLGALERFSAAMRTAAPEDRVSLREVVNRQIAVADSQVALSDLEAEALPTLAEWSERQASIRELARSLQEICGVGSLADHPWRWVPRALFTAARPLEAVTAALARARDALGAVRRALGDAAARASLGEIETWAAYVELARPLVERGFGQMVTAEPTLLTALRASVVEIAEAERKADAARNKIGAWREPLSPDDAAAALAQARAVESAFGFLRPTWWRLKKLLDARYDFASHAVRPTRVAVLETLCAHHAAKEAHEQALAAARTRWGADGVVAVLPLVEKLVAEGPRFAGARERLGATALSGPAGALPTLWAACKAALAEIVVLADALSLADVEARLTAIERALPALPELLPHLGRLAADASDALWKALTGRSLSPDALTWCLTEAALRRAYRADRGLARTTGFTVAEHVARVREGVESLRAVNARWVAATAHARFRAHVTASELPSAQLPAEQREWKKRYTRGRRELEHEFAKVMRHRAIRELATGDTGLVVADLKPVWLMSPLSVSDALPLETSGFDVIIFDEASQIPAEEAVPSLFRAPQAIVVGDRQQLPPTDFFSSRTPADEEDDDQAPEPESFELESDSFLTQATANLPSTMLAWHYRSRSEALISFSNASFYGGRLLTVPDPQGAHVRAPIEITSAEEGDAHAAHVVDRPLSFHRVKGSPYVDRRNAGEAAYIARLVRGLLAREAGLSLGIVAFSMAQQGEIEEALASLAAADPDFAQRYERELVREDDDQFCGLFVKNLENVQGDERDVIIVSICYGPGPDGKMLMNFGPINKSGGERRLNVVFSRAKRHVAVVSSILGEAITNTYNDGANCLRRYLELSAASSAGETHRARQVLETCCPDLARVRKAATASEATADTLARALEARGLEVTRGVGSSHFRCDLAVRLKGQADHRVGVLLDTTESYATTGALERWVDRPELLARAGWTPLIVLGKDVLENVEAVAARIEKLVALPAGSASA